MFVGHFAVGFAAKRVAPSVPLGVLFAAALLPDLVWPIFLLLGIERVVIAPGDTAVTPLSFVYYPWTHSLAMVVAWGLLAAALWRAAGRRAGGAPTAAGSAAIVGLAVASHWVLDAVTHRPDLPLYPGGSTLVGLGLWRSVPGTVAVETAVFAGGVVLYAVVTAPRDRAGRMGLVLLVAVLYALYIANLLGPPPPDARTLALVALGIYLLPLWASRVDRRRKIRTYP